MNQMKHVLATTEDKEVVLKAMRVNGGFLSMTSDQFRYNKDVVLAAVTNNGYALIVANSFKDDRDVLTAATTYKGKRIDVYRDDVLRFASEQAKNDPYLKLTLAIKRYFLIYRWPRLVRLAIKTQLAKDDDAFAKALEPANVALMAEEIINGGDETGPQPTALWTAVMNNNRNKLTT